VHSVAQSLITLITFQELDGNPISVAHSVLQWTMANLWDERGYFYHQKQKWATLKTPYMRWGQAWMLLALATLLELGSAQNGSHAAPRANMQEVAA
jgi:hypothetical protein